MRWNGEERRSFDHGTVAMEARDIALKALHQIETHTRECESRQTRIEKQADEIKVEQRSIAAEITEINVRQAEMSTKQNAIAEFQTTMSKKIDGLGSRLGKLELRVALLVGGLYGASKLIERFF